uniref:DUF7041 domain-containing protein n=1 Tax=Trichuris muris TaxID=70415 RepID=A0A5S6QS94_TRIMR
MSVDGEATSGLGRRPGDSLKAEPNGPTQVYAVRELAQFNAQDVNTWLLMCENLLEDARVNRQETMFRKVLAQLPPETFGMVKHLVVQRPLPADCFDQLKECLRRRLTLTPADRFRKLEQLPLTLGDMKPSEFYRQLELLYPEEVGLPLVREIFLKRLPPALGMLCREWLKTRTLAGLHG